MNRENRVAWQQELVKRADCPQEPLCPLVADIPLEDAYFGTLKEAVFDYLKASFGDESIADDAAMQDRLDNDLDQLHNRTPNGALVPKREFQTEFNRVQAAVAAWLESLGITDMIDSVFCPVTVRLVKGESDAEADNRPYASAKLHVDLWAGDPADTVSIIIPVLGDLEKTKIEWYDPPEGFEEKYLKMMDSYDVSQELEGKCAHYPLTANHGHAYFVDAATLHKTVREGGGSRVNIQFCIRRPLSAEDRAKVDALFPEGRLNLYLEPEEWYALGREKFMQFEDTNADAAKGIYREHQDNERTYAVVDRLPDRASV